MRVQALLLMVLIILLGFLMVFSGYSITSIAVASVAYFGIKFWTALWAVAYWLDNNMIAAMTPSENGIVATVAYAIGLGDKQWLFNFITSAFYISLPLIWTLMLSWAGYRIGNLMAPGQAAMLGAEAAGESGGRATHSATLRTARR